jgi:hypothetical protein
MLSWRVTVIAGSFLVMALVLSLLCAAADPPYVIEDAPTEVTFEEDGSTADLNLYDVFADDDPEDENLTFSVFEAEHILIDLDQPTGDVNITAEEDWNGQAEVVFRATDGRGDIADHTISVTVLAVNDPPRARGKIAREIWDEGETHQFNVSAYFTDVDGDALYYYAEIEPDYFTITNMYDDHCNPLFDLVPLDPLFYGYLQVWFTAYDKDPETSPDEALSANQTAIFEVRGENSRPTVESYNPTESIITINETESVTFSIDEMTDIDSSNFHCRWAVNGEQLWDHQEMEFQYPLYPSYITAGTYEIAANAMDNLGAIAWNSPTWTLIVVNVNRPPEVDLLVTELTVTRGQDFTLNATAVDLDGDSLTFHWFLRTGKNRTKLIGEGRTLVYEKDLDPGEYQFRCEVRDGNDTVTSDWMTVTVEDSPTWSLINVLALVVGVAVVWGIIIWLRSFHSKAY